MEQSITLPSTKYQREQGHGDTFTMRVVEPTQRQRMLIRRSFEMVYQCSRFSWEQLMSMKHVYTYQCKTMATDGARLYINPKYVEWLEDTYPSIRPIAGVLIHESEHRSNGHFSRQDRFDHRLWNIATDHGINARITWLNQKLSGFEPCMPYESVILKDDCGEIDFKYLEWRSERIYRDLERQQKQQEQEQGDQQQDGDDQQGSGSAGDQSDGDQQQDEGPVPEDQAPEGGEYDWENIVPGEVWEISEEEQEQVEAAVYATGFGAGSDDGPMVSKPWTQGTSNGVEWQNVIENLFAPHVAVDQSWSRLNRSMFAMGIDWPGDVMSEGARRFAVLCDVSASMDQAKWNKATTHINDMWEKTQPDEIVLMIVNNKLVDVRHFYKGQDLDFDVRVGGGTRLDAAFEALPEHCPDADAVLCFTDLDVFLGRDLKADPGVETVFLCTDEGRTAPFGKVVYI